ncbi:MAG: DUF1828 domain-containing protein [Chloroflexi bacterium]|nr:DUF1828 domain-containing protein [Chloroflexota bacterium]
MATFECERLAQDYADWVRQRIKVQNIGDVCVLTTPFLDKHRDLLQIYVERTDSGLLLSDDGYILRDLQMSGLELDTERRKELLHHILLSFGVTIKGEELQAVASEKTFAQKKHDFVQAMLAISSLVHLARPTVAAVFKEDVARFLRDNQVRFVSDVKLTGESGLHHPFDFVIGAAPDRPERYLRAIGTPDRESVVEFMFSWQDVKRARPSDAVAFAVLNDQEQRRISPDHVSALEKYAIEVIRWTDRNSKLAKLQG